MVEPAQDWPDFTKAMLLVGVDSSGNPVGVLVDDDGNLNAILKGAGPAGLTTIGVDADGRIEVFLLDAEDQWGNVRKVGNAELAGRLGSPVTWDWRGNVLVLNTFGSGAGAILKYATGTGSLVQCSPTTWLTGGFSLLLQGGTGSTDYAGYDGRLGINPSLTLGFTIAWADFGAFDYLTIEVWGVVGTDAYLGRLKWTRSSGVLQYLDAAAGYQTIATVSAASAAYSFNYAKVVINLGQGKYVRALWNDTEYDLSSVVMYTWAFPTGGTMGYKVRVYPGAPDYAGIYVDHHIITVNEPT